MNNLTKKENSISRFQFIKSELNSFVLKEFKLLLFLFLLVTSVLMIFVLADLFFDGELQEFDNSVLQFFRNTENLEKAWGPVWLLEVMRDLTALGGVTFLTILVSSVVGYLIIQRNFKLVVYLLVAVIGGAIISVILKELIGRPRPDAIYQMMAVSLKSFPSGHSMLSATTYLTIAALLSQIQKRLLIRFYVVVFALIIVLLVGVSRMYLGVHYFSDVLAGWSFGLFWASICWYLFWMRRKKEPESFKT